MFLDANLRELFHLEGIWRTLTSGVTLMAVFIGMDYTLHRMSLK